MEEKIFNVEKLNFKNRIKKDAIFKIITFFTFFSVILFSIQNNEFGKIEIISTLFILVIVIYITLMESIDYIYEIRIDSQKIKIFGEKFNRNWETTLDIQKVKIKIIEQRSKSGNIIGYLIDLKTKDKKFRINKLFNWDNFTLYSLFKTFKFIKEEKILFEEKSLINEIEKRAKENFE